MDEQFAFQQIIDAAIQHKVDVVAAGDLLDKQSNRSETITFVYKQLDRLKAAKQKFFFTQGQHDYDDPPWLSGHPAAVHMHKQVIDFGQILMYGLDWQPYGKLQDELSAIPDSVNLLVCHQVWSDWMGERAAPQGSMSEIPGHVQYVHTGDLHAWKLERKKNLDGEKMMVLSCGATTKQKIDEPDNHYYALLYPDGRFEKKGLKSRVFIDASVMVRTEDIDDFVANLESALSVAEQRGAALDLPEAMQVPLLRVRYASKLTDAVRRVEKAVKDRAILFFTQMIPEEKEVAYKKAKSTEKGAAVTPASVLPQEVDKEEQPEVYTLVERMLAATDKELEFAKWRTEFMGETPS